MFWSTGQRDTPQPERGNAAAARQPGHTGDVDGYEQFNGQDEAATGFPHHNPTASDLYDGTAENLSLLQRNAGGLDLLQRISVGHQFP